ncbi:hypothetical protein ACJIZ3_022906 [Penstemon smallii]|uniref:Uncharacterized protein n=1 Tax=Penstemon smallii TaxID=265156 RepID=A0ABD3TPW1_9LAMI
MAEKRKRIRRTMIDAISEAETSSATRSSSTQSVSRFCSRSGTISSPAHQNQLPNNSPRTGRGRSKQTPLWDSGVKLQVHLTSDGRIDGPNRAKFKTQLGVLARNSIKFPLTCKSFKKIGDGTKDDIWRNIKENTTLSDEAKSIVFEDINAKWKQGKYRLKRKNYLPYEDDNKRMDELEKDCVPPDQVKSIIDQWNSPKTQVIVIMKKYWFFFSPVMSCKIIRKFNR